jgi:hypothetical protein
MSPVLHLPARSDAPIACDMSTAIDTPDERLAEYAHLFEAALVRRERLEHAVVFVFRATTGARAKVDDLARREAACCPFMDYRVETVGDEVIYTITNPVDEPDVDTMLDAVYALPDHAGDGIDGLLGRIAETGVDVVETDTNRFEWRSSTGR